MTNLDEPAGAVTQALAALSGHLQGGTFACRKTVSSDMLKLSVDRVGDLRLPLPGTQAKALASIAKPAPYGLGTKTLHDASVRDVGEIKAAKVRFDRRAWNRELKPVLEQMRIELGLPTGRLTAQLDKLLVYGPGQFFKPHKDSERNDTMVGTMVVVLPSKHKGGSLIVSHSGNTRRFTIRNSTDRLLRLFAFYATCEHEVRPVTEGHRVVLSFHLLFKSAKPASPIPTEPDPLVRDSLNTFFNPKPDSAHPHARQPEKLVFLLDHDYSQRSLAWQQLKGVDHVHAAALQVVGDALGMETHLALVKVNEIWDASDDDHGSYYRQSRSHWDDDDTDSSDDKGEKNVEIGELIDRDASLEHWRDASNHPVDLPAIITFADELCWLAPLESKSPQFEEYEGYMGNYGNTVQREYQRAAVVIWPAQNRYRILASRGAGQGGVVAISELSRDAEVLDANSLQHCVNSLLEVWPGWHRVCDSRTLAKALKLSMQLDNTDTVVELLRSFSLVSLKASHLKSLFALGNRFGSAFCEKLFAHWSGAIRPVNLQVQQRSAHRPFHHGRGFVRDEDTRVLEWLPMFNTFIQRVQSDSKDAWRTIPESLFDTLHQRLRESHAEHHARKSLAAQRKFVEQEEAQLILLFEAGRIISDTRTVQVVAGLTNHLQEYASEVPIAMLEHVEALNNSSSLGRSLDVLRKKARVLVQKRAEQAGRAENDWRINVVPTCDCVDCQTLAAFLKSNEFAVGLPLAKERRKHLHRCIEKLDIPVSHSTTRQGRPFTLTLRKRRELFTAAAREQAREMALSKKRVLLE